MLDTEKRLIYNNDENDHKEAKMINQKMTKAEEKNLHIITTDGQILEAISAWAKIEMVEGFSQVPEPGEFNPEAHATPEEIAANEAGEGPEFDDPDNRNMTIYDQERKS